ncbi:MAG: hypothetical protein NTZ51_11930 [Proteobacteria bacterium]|nr:hypothetical protein [Pseudomonadota bacterium]
MALRRAGAKTFFKDVRGSGKFYSRSLVEESAASEGIEVTVDE